MRRLHGLLAFALLLLGAAQLYTQQAAGTLRVHFVDVGQGDAVLIQSPSGQNVIYDAGEHPTRMRDYLTSLGMSEVRLVIASHNHADHIGGLAQIIGLFRPAFYMDNGVPATTHTYARLLEAVRGAGSQLIEPTERRIQLGDAALSVIPPPGIPDWDHNDNSIGIVVEYGSFSNVPGGDAEPREWAWWLTQHTDLLPKVQVHKSSHTVLNRRHRGRDCEAGTRSRHHQRWRGQQLRNTPIARHFSSMPTKARPSIEPTCTARSSWRPGVRRLCRSRREGEGAQPPPATPVPAPSTAPTPAPSPAPPPSSWSGPLPTPTIVNGRPTCSAALFPPVTSCANDIIGAPSAVCKNGRYSCSAAASGTCSGNGGVQCWKCPDRCVEIDDGWHRGGSEESRQVTPMDWPGSSSWRPVARQSPTRKR